MDNNVDYSGMTVNERLFAAGLLDEFDAAARQRDRGRLVSILMRVQLSPSEAESTVDWLLSDPPKFGY